MSDPINKPSVIPPDLLQQDWFLPAILCEGNVRDCLEAVLDKVDRKRDFLNSVRKNLCNEDGNIDHLTILARQVKELENTLRFRLGILHPDRHSSWFREAAKRDFGPFKSSMLLAAIFPNYALDDVIAVKKSLYDAWHAGDTLPTSGKLNFQNSLWGILLDKRSETEAMSKLSGRFGHLRLDKLPEELPQDLDSKSLRAFLLNVRGEFKAVRERLNVCFDQLWSASEKLWESQLKFLAQQQEKQKRDKQPSGAGARTQSSSQSQAQSKSQNKDSFRNEQTRRRSPFEMVLGFEEIEAMRFMGFEQKPTKDDLRRRYLELAKKMHPDRNGGNEESFKMLNKAYNSLLTRLVRD